MDKDEALKLALEALQWNWGGEPLPTLELQAINAIKEALAQSDDLTIAYMAGFYDGKNNRIDKFLQGEDYRVMYLKVRDELAELQQRTEQDGQCKRCTDGCPACDARKLPKQEPVAWMRGDEDCSDCIVFVWEQTEEHTIPLYTAPPRREWVGLTDEERDHFEGLHLYAGRNQVEAWIEGVPSFIDAIEAKLREKNGG